MEFMDLVEYFITDSGRFAVKKMTKDQFNKKLSEAKKGSKI